MTKTVYVAGPAALCLLGIGLHAIDAHAAGGDWKRGRVYYQKVCTDCHTAKAGGAIAPNARTMADWNAYLNADKHARGKDSLRKYASREYRASVKGTNKAAEKYADVPDEQLFNDIRSFMLKGAKDGDSPASCN
ncbi:MAG: c-type cytochrome [Betaproteobacteria bacterium]|nr:MAG: c-type cytochrome [Betaproteobacteria bacterium]